MCAQLVGLDALRTKTVDKTHKLLIDHITALRGNSELQRSLVVLVLESNLGFESQHLAAALQRANVGNWLCLQEGAGGSTGWLTTNSTKEAMCLRTREALRVGSLVLWDKFQCLSQAPKDAIAQLNKELSNFCIISEPAKHLFGVARKTYTGETSESSMPQPHTNSIPTYHLPNPGKIGGQQDDLCIALQLAISGSRVFKTSDKYSKYQWRSVKVFQTPDPLHPPTLTVCACFPYSAGGRWDRGLAATKILASHATTECPS